MNAFRLLTSVALLLSASGADAAPVTNARPNVLFIVVDDLRPELGCYGVTNIKSPNIDSLAKSGIQFNRAYCQDAVCSPSRSSFLTGMRPDTTKVWDLKTHFRAALPDVVTLPQLFKNNGYFVQGMGKIYHGELGDESSWSVPLKRPPAKLYALPENIALNERKSAVTPAKVAEPDDYRLPKQLKKSKPTGDEIAGDVKTDRFDTSGPAFECADVPDDAYVDGKLADLAVSTLREMSQKSEPFFLAVGFIKPHLPFVAPKKYWDLYDPTKIELASNPFRPKGAPDYALLPGGEMRVYNGIPKSRVPDDLARQLKHGYYACVSYTDAQVGKVLAELDRLNLRSNTIVVIWGDHGWKLGEHDAWCKHSNVENDTRAPLLLSAPGMKNVGSRTDALVEFVDVYPTLAELAGLPLPEKLEGVSLRPLLDDPKRAWKPAAFSQYPRNLSGGRHLMGYSMRTDRYRFTRWVQRDDHSKVDAVELYDHQTDPQENTNIANDPANKELVAQLTRQWLSGWQGAKPRASQSASLK